MKCLDIIRTHKGKIRKKSKPGIDGKNVHKFSKEKGLKVQVREPREQLSDSMSCYNLTQNTSMLVVNTVAIAINKKSDNIQKKSCTHIISIYTQSDIKSSPI